MLRRILRAGRPPKALNTLTTAVGCPKGPKGLFEQPTPCVKMEPPCGPNGLPSLNAKKHNTNGPTFGGTTWLQDAAENCWRPSAGNASGHLGGRSVWHLCFRSLWPSRPSARMSTKCSILTRGGTNRLNHNPCAKRLHTTQCTQEVYKENCKQTLARSFETTIGANRV